MKNVSLPQLTNNLAEKIIGIWMLRSRKDVDERGRVRVDPFLGPEPLGILCFGPTNFAAQFMKRDRSDQEQAPQRPQAKNNTVGVNGYDSYFGTYTTDEDAGTLTTNLEGSISAANIGSTFVRDVRAVGDELIIQLETTAVDGTPITRTNTFFRVG